MAYLEKNFQTDWNRWFKHILKRTGAYELKVSHGASLPFSAVVEHQRNALQAAKHSCIVHKMPDTGYQNPFDAFALCNTPAFVVVMFNTDTQRKEFVMIDIDVFLQEEATSSRKSLTEERAKELGHVCILSADSPAPSF